MNSKLAYLFFATCVASCELPGSEPKPPQLPPITTEGKNTFGCKINGVVHIPKGNGFAGGPSKGASITYDNDTTFFTLWSGNSSLRNSLVLTVFEVGDLRVGEVYDLSDLNYQIEYREYDRLCFYDIILKGQLVLSKYDKSKSIVSGTFDFTASSIAPECPENKNVTEGRFDMIFESSYKN